MNRRSDRGDGWRLHAAWAFAAAAMVACAPLVKSATAEPDKPAPKAGEPQRAAIEGAMNQMKQAVLAGDGAAYLAHVVPAAGRLGDAVFRKEQENWAKDFKGHVPAEFDLVIDDEATPARFTAERAEFDLKMKWRMSAPEGQPPRRSREVAMPVVFRLDDQRPESGWLFAGENWVVVEGEEGVGIRVMCSAGLERAARDAVAVFPEVRRHVEEGFEEKVPHVQEVKIYASMRHLQASIYLSYVDSLGGWNEPGESIKVLGSAATSKAALRPLLAHEFGHVATFEYGPHATDIPWWILEGVAEMSSEEFSKNLWDMTERMVRNWARADTLAKWDDITDFRSTPTRLHMYVYRQGQHMVGYISDKYGRAGRNAWLRAMAQGKSLDEATKEALHLSFDDLDRQWRASLVDPPPEKPKKEEHQE